MVLKAKLVNGQWISPPTKFCGVCCSVIHELETECMVCKDLKAGELRNQERWGNPKRCPTCGEFLTNGHCRECNVQVILT